MCRFDDEHFLKCGMLFSLRLWALRVLLSYLKYVKTILHVQKDLYQMYVNYTSFMKTGIKRLFSRFLPVHF